MMSNKRWHLQIKSRVSTTERKNFAMQNNNYQTKHPRGSSPPFHEMEKGFDYRVGRLPLIIQTPTDTQREKQKQELADQISDPVLQTDDEGYWQDEGGEGG